METRAYDEKLEGYVAQKMSLDAPQQVTHNTRF